jgi:nickel transport protein
MKRKALQQIFFALFLISVVSTPSFAHKVRIFAWEEGGNLITESKFSGGNPAKNATVSVVDSANGKELLSGTTDMEGIFSFPLQNIKAKELEIIINGGDGHKNSWHYVLEEPSKITPQPPLPVPEKQVIQTAKAADTDQSLSAVTQDELKRLLETTIDKQLAPIKRTLAENSDKGPTLQDILGGIGYIFGLAGVAAYVQSLKKKKE